MSEIILVRHGQASFGAESYDKLSELGVEQVRELARHWQATGDRFDHIVSGQLLRQRETAAELLPLVAGTPASPEIHPSFNEYNGDPLMQIYLRTHAASEGFANVDWPIRDSRLFQKVFEAATAKWIAGELLPDAQDTGFEYWEAFQERVHSGLNQLMEQHTGGRRILLSTSGGVIAMALQRVLDFPDQQVIATNWMVHNSSVTKIRYGNGKVSLTQFNSLPHLERSELQHMITYR